MKDLIPALTRDKVYWLPITYYRSPLRLLMAQRPFSVQHNDHGVSNVESGISRRRQPTRATGLLIGLLLVLIAECIGRGLFYGLHMTVGMAVAG